MNKDYILVLVRYALTIVGVLLTQANLVTEGEWKNIVNALSEGVGAALVVASMVWSFVKSHKRQQLEKKVNSDLGETK